MFTYLRTTTMGDSEFVIIPRPFHIIRPEAMTDAKLRTWRRTFENGPLACEHYMRAYTLTWRKPSLLKAFSSSVNIESVAKTI